MYRLLLRDDSLALVLFFLVLRLSSLDAGGREQSEGARSIIIEKVNKKFHMALAAQRAMLDALMGAGRNASSDSDIPQKYICSVAVVFEVSCY